MDKTSYFTELKRLGVLLENKEKLSIIFNAINSLLENQRAIFTLAKIDGKSYQETLEITAKSLLSVESIFLRAKKSLHQKLENFIKK